MLLCDPSPACGPMDARPDQGLALCRDRRQDRGGSHCSSLCAYSVNTVVFQLAQMHSEADPRKGLARHIRIEQLPKEVLEGFGAPPAERRKCAFRKSLLVTLIAIHVTQPLEEASYAMPQAPNHGEVFACTSLPAIAADGAFPNAVCINSRQQSLIDRRCLFNPLHRLRYFRNLAAALRTLTHESQRPLKGFERMRVKHGNRELFVWLF